MEFSDIIIIDIREEFELLGKQMHSVDPSVFVINIPMRSIFANTDWINELSQSHNIYIICRHGIRASKVKDKYFKDNKNIISLDGGITKLEINNIFDNKIKLIHGKGGLGLQQYTQIMFASILTVLAILLYFDIDKKYVISLIVLIVLFILYQLLTNVCYLFKFLPLPVFHPKN